MVANMFFGGPSRRENLLPPINLICQFRLGPSTVSSVSSPALDHDCRRNHPSKSVVPNPADVSALCTLPDLSTPPRVGSPSPSYVPMSDSRQELLIHQPPPPYYLTELFGLEKRAVTRLPPLQASFFLGGAPRTSPPAIGGVMRNDRHSLLPLVVSHRLFHRSFAAFRAHIDRMGSGERVDLLPTGFLSPFCNTFFFPPPSFPPPR